MSAIDDLIAAILREREAYSNPIGTEENPYVIVVPRWYADMCIERGTTPQEVYDREFAGTPFRHGRVDIMEDYPT